MRKRGRDVKCDGAQRNAMKVMVLFYVAAEGPARVAVFPPLALRLIVADDEAMHRRGLNRKDNCSLVKPFLNASSQEVSIGCAAPTSIFVEQHVEINLFGRYSAVRCQRQVVKVNNEKADCKNGLLLVDCTGDEGEYKVQEPNDWGWTRANE